MKFLRNIFTKYNEFGLSYETVTDIDGNVYKTVKIGKQIWLSENLNVTHYRNGDIIPFLQSRSEWNNAGDDKKPAFCNPKERMNTELVINGKFYNWYAIVDPRMIAPVGWHIPSYDEYLDLVTYLGGKEKAEPKLKSAAGWYRTNGNNKSSFSALPIGFRTFHGDLCDFVSFRSSADFWTSTESSYNGAYCLSLEGGIGCVIGGNLLSEIYKGSGASCRCIKD